MNRDEELLAEIRDLLVELRDMQRAHQAEYARFASESIGRQVAAVRMQRIGLLGVALLVMLAGVVAVAYALVP